jgi:hypothetical protein
VIVQVLIGLAIAVWGIVIKFPRVQRFFGTLNQDKIATLNTIKDNVELVAKASRPNLSKENIIVPDRFNDGSDSPRASVGSS